ncbi:predicted protein [Naegleria gruberi]|uniref:Predicted protein n=1 Tax=Naegleria gruberi TaxID=5762 RepID=D2W5Z8_NAEGR|nr:uncharacterized protein NAEGRDRAFT_76841 [Naegleria gruberi]EFC35502.1 predicted protein [Naegleria gruberi]|eukprot:XP_002668246.1 predicted protein [Naegleria gruberi strain NEG-M]
MYDILVPKYVDDITFWKSYFYCLHRILFTQNIDELDEEICELYNKRRRQQMERELELQEYCNAIESDCKIIHMIIKMEIENINQILLFEKNLNNQIINSIDNDIIHENNINQNNIHQNNSNDSNENSNSDSNNNNEIIDNSNISSNESNNETLSDNTTNTNTNIDNSSTSTSTSTTSTSTPTTSTTNDKKKMNEERKRREEEYHTNKQLIEEKIREVIEIKKKVSLFSSEIITNETLIERISQSNHCFMQTFT